MSDVLTEQTRNHDFLECICLLGCKYHQLHHISQIHGVNHPVLYDKLGYRPETKQNTLNFLLVIILIFARKRKHWNWIVTKTRKQNPIKMVKFGEIYDFCEKLSWNVTATPLLIFGYFFFWFCSEFNFQYGWKCRKNNAFYYLQWHHAINSRWRSSVVTHFAYLSRFTNHFSLIFVVESVFEASDLLQMWISSELCLTRLIQSFDDDVLGTVCQLNYMKFEIRNNGRVFSKIMVSLSEYLSKSNKEKSNDFLFLRTKTIAIWSKSMPH